MSAPQSHDQGNPPEPQFQAERQRQVEALADAYLERLLAGETPDRQELLAAHPELADLLGPRLELVELMHRVARGQRPAAGKLVNAVPGERALRVKCPHCGNGIQLVEPESTEVTCSGCGSSFHVEPGVTTSFHSASLPRMIGRFEVLEQLGRGAFGIVYKARDPQLQRIVAVKVPRAGSFATAEEEERFLREARAAAQLNHPGIVPVLEIAHDRNLPYIVSAYIEGLRLADMLTARRPSYRETAELAAAVADALDFAHRQKIVHRDIKPSNLLLDAAGRPHITDFGLARRGEPEITVTLDGQILGTPAYMSPEQAAGDQQHVDARSDVYSLGVVLYELLTGELPFRGNQRMLLHQVIHDEPRPPRSLNDRVPRDLETICLKAMAKTPARRYASAQEMADDLRRFLNGEPIRARRVGRAEKLARWARRNPQVAALMALVALLLIAVSVGEFLFVVTERRLIRDLSNALDTSERNHREAELRAASAVVDLDLKYCEDGEIEYGVLRLAGTLGKLPSHATELRQCVEMNLLAWAQEIQPLGPTFQYDGAETTWELSPDGLTVLTGGADGTARLWDAFTGEVRTTLRGHRGQINSVAFSQNGRVAMTVGTDDTVRLWNGRNGAAMGVAGEDGMGISRALLSPNGERLLTFPDEKPENGSRTLTLWDTTTGQRISVLAGDGGHVNDAAFSPDGKMLLTGGADKTARLWSTENGRPLATLEGHTQAVDRVAFNPDGSMTATLDASGLVRWWDPHTRRQIHPPCRSSRTDMSAWGEIDRPEFYFIQREVATLDGWNGMGPLPGACFIRGLENSIEFPALLCTNCKADEDCVVDPQGRVYDQKMQKRRYPSVGRKFNEELARFATEQRFLVVNTNDWISRYGSLVDVGAEKWVGSNGATKRRIGYNNTARGPRYVPSRRTFIAQEWPSPRYVPLPGAPLDAELARLFAEVVTCHELDSAGPIRLLTETEWEERRRKLARQLDEHSVAPLIGRLAADRWFWLRQQADRALAKNAHEEEIKYLDRLIAVEPTWQNYQWRAVANRSAERRVKAGRDLLEAARRAGGGYWQSRIRTYGSYELTAGWGWNLADGLILPATGTPEEHQVGLRLVETLSGTNPENDEGLPLLQAIALFRVGHYAEALRHLDDWRLRQRVLPIVAHAGQYILLGRFAPLLKAEATVTTKDDIRVIAFLAMVHHRLRNPEQARAALDHLRRMGETAMPQAPKVDWKSFDPYKNLLREAETLIEGKPRPDK